MSAFLPPPRRISAFLPRLASPACAWCAVRPREWLTAIGHATFKKLLFCPSCTPHQSRFVAVRVVGHWFYRPQQPLPQCNEIIYTHPTPAPFFTFPTRNAIGRGMLRSAAEEAGMTSKPNICYLMLGKMKTNMYTL